MSLERSNIIQKREKAKIKAGYIINKVTDDFFPPRPITQLSAGDEIIWPHINIHRHELEGLQTAKHCCLRRRRKKSAREVVPEFQSPARSVLAGYHSYRKLTQHPPAFFFDTGIGCFFFFFFHFLFASGFKHTVTCSQSESVCSSLLEHLLC